MKREWDTVAIVGVGLIGGSVGMAMLQRGLARAVVGIGRRPESLDKAKRRGAISVSTTDLAEGVADADLVVICTPVNCVVSHVRQVAKHCPAGTLITDVASTKQHIVEQIPSPLDRDVRFVGSHPLAGSEKAGPEFARPDLFDGRTVVVTPTPATVADDCDTIERLWRSVGARVVRMPADEHDRAVASTSHMPHVAAAAVAAATPDEFLSLASTGWADTTRVASGDIELWRQILVDNRQFVAEAIERLEQHLAAYREALAVDDQAKLMKLLEAGKQKRDAVGN